jgi:FolB domain-containing protein
MATIYIKDLVVSGTHGHHPHEKTKPQLFGVSVELQVADKATDSDDLADTVNWSSVRDQIINVVQNNSFNLIEKLAQAIGEELIKDRKIKKATVAVDKLEAFESGVPGARIEISS